MAVIEVRSQEESISAGSLKPKNLLIQSEGGIVEYIKVIEVNKVKTGKHGPAKVMVFGRKIKSDKTVSLAFKGDTNVLIATLTKKQFIIEDIYEDDESFYMRPNDSSVTQADLYPYNQMDQEDVKSVIDAFNANGKQEIVVTLMLAPNYCSFEDIRPNVTK